MTDKSLISQLIKKHQQLDDDLASNEVPFLSDWNGSHPFSDAFLGPDLALPTSSRTLRYHFFTEDHDLACAIALFHQQKEKLHLTSDQILAGEGSSTFLTAIALWLKDSGVDQVFYLPPIYYTLHYFLRLLGIRVRPLARDHLFDIASLSYLPDKKTVLIFADPVWYAGRRVGAHLISEVRDWQERTGSTVFIDGSFQFTQWDGTRREWTSLLNPDLTLRLVAPTKSLGLPAFRFSYLLHPASMHKDFTFLYESLTGATSHHNLAFAHRAMEVLNSGEANIAFSSYLGNVYQELTKRGLISTDIDPDCSYFTFAKPRLDFPMLTMDRSYFEQRKYPGYVRINLMVAQRYVTDPRRTAASS